MIAKWQQTVDACGLWVGSHAGSHISSYNVHNNDKKNISSRSFCPCSVLFSPHAINTMTYKVSPESYLCKCKEKRRGKNDLPIMCLLSSHPQLGLPSSLSFASALGHIWHLKQTHITVLNGSTVYDGICVYLSIDISMTSITTVAGYIAPIFMRNYSKSIKVPTYSAFLMTSCSMYATISPALSFSPTLHGIPLAAYVQRTFSAK